MSHRLNSNNLSPTNSNGIPRTSFSMDSGLPSVVTDQPAIAEPMTVNKLLSNLNHTIPSEDPVFSPKETPRESQKNN
ncbi:UNVERIFIED_CONTAM: hypothetical protein GTU68_023536 [Idotea baltica]|nr:hypothetical protein [Idotea baltica]